MRSNSLKPGRGPSLEADHTGILILEFQPSELWQISVFCKLFNMWYFVTVVWIDWHIRIHRHTHTHADGPWYKHEQFYTCQTVKKMHSTTMNMALCLEKGLKFSSESGHRMGCSIWVIAVNKWWKETFWDQTRSHNAKCRWVFLITHTHTHTHTRCVWDGRYYSCVTGFSWVHFYAFSYYSS